MEERLPELHARLESLTELQEIVGALRSIAIMRMQQAFGALPGIRHYAQAIDEALAQAIPLLGKSDPWSSPTAGKGRTGVFAFTSEHGLVGAYNERILERASAAAGHDGALMMVGARGETLAEEQGRPGFRHQHGPALELWAPAGHVPPVTDVEFVIVNQHDVQV